MDGRLAVGGQQIDHRFNRFLGSTDKGLLVFATAKNIKYPQSRGGTGGRRGWRCNLQVDYFWGKEGGGQFTVHNVWPPT